ncbi:MAG: hypothetical protein V4649_15685 [Bacteroidota bacterium]
MSAPQKILLIQLMSNGDCLYATAIARQIKTDYPGCHLTWAVATFCKGILDNNPYIDATWELEDVNKNTSTRKVREVRAKAEQLIAKGELDRYFFTQIIDYNLANYDGSIRSSIFRGYGKPITVPVTPVVRLRQAELDKATAFAERHRLRDYKNVILFEFAPQSGQLAMTPALAIGMAKELATDPNTAIILSSAIKVNEPEKNVIDGSELTLRETAAITHYCTMLLGCSSGITWITTSDAAKLLPMIQLLNADAYWVNPISRDFERFGLPADQVLEVYDKDITALGRYAAEAIANGFKGTRDKYQQPLPIQFKTTRRSIYNMLVAGHFGAILKHIRISISVFGWQPLLFWEIFLGFATAPFKLVGNIMRKRILKKQ